jgi:membrane-bound serine protease (ClpP class)
MLLPAGRVRALPIPSSAATSDRWVDLIDIDGSINPAAADFIEDSIAKAHAGGASALVIRLDTPGGLLSSAQKIVKTILNAPLPIVVYVAPQGAFAASAGTFVTEAANIAAMAPGTTIGAAHPLESNGSDVPEGKGAEKIENFTAAFAKTIAHQRGRNEAWFEDAVRKSNSISEREALKLHVIDIVANDLDDLLKQATGRTVTLADGRAIKLDLAGAAPRAAHMTLGQSVLNRLADPNIVYLLMIAGVIGLYFEFAHPGVYLPGVAGAICLLIALASFQLIPINLAGLLLIVLGMGMLLAELFVTSYGVLGIGGVIAFVIGSLFLVDTSQSNLTVSRGIIAGTAVGFSAIVLGIGYLAIRGRRGRASTGGEGMVGMLGEVRAAIAPGIPGQLFVHGEIWRAVSDQPIAVGTRARILAVRGLEVAVRPE